VPDSGGRVGLPTRVGSGNRLGTALASLLEAVESDVSSDSTIKQVREVVQRSLRPGRLRSLLSGTPLGHPAHPLLVDLPIGFWTSAMALDLTGNSGRQAARRLVGLGVLSAVPAVATGLSDWLDTDGAEARVGLVHAAANTTAVTCYALSWWARRRGGLAGQGWSLAGATAATLGGWLGGHLAYGLGVGVDTNAFETGPDEWTMADGPVPHDGSPSCVVAGGVRIAVLDLEGEQRALADRCSHRGGPLSEGHRSGDCLVCPWHGSAFDLRTGVPSQGPASLPQPTYETRTVSGVLEVRRDEPRALRTRAVRPPRS
jgi:nitrite reductase/ring-hydroxylating ferredoxin subunit/uncharacterized membrane protein